MRSNTDVLLGTYNVLLLSMHNLLFHLFLPFLCGTGVSVERLEVDPVSQTKSGFFGRSAKQVRKYIRMYMQKAV